MLKQVNRSELEVGMVVGRDVITDDGSLIIPKDSKLSDSALKKMDAYGISRVTILLEEGMPLSQETPTMPEATTDSKAFIEFLAYYNNHVSEVAGQLNEIIGGKVINMKDIQQLLDSLVLGTPNQSLLLGFMYQLNKSNNSIYAHSINVSILARILGKWLSYGAESIMELGVAGFIHDIGKLRINPPLKGRIENFTQIQYQKYMQHVTLGYEMVKQMTLPIGVKQCVLFHHERYDRQGFPMQPDWVQVHDYAKIIAIVDRFDILTSKRPYGYELHPFKAIRDLEEHGYTVYDPGFLYVFLENIAHNYIGSQVRMADHTLGTIVFINSKNPSRPLVELMNGTMLDMSFDYGKDIIDFI